MEYVMGLDIGTSGAKGMVFDEEGSCVLSAMRRYRLQTPSPDWRVIDFNEMEQAVFDLIQELTHCAKPGKVVALCSSALGEAVTPFDHHGKPLDYCIPAIDARATYQIDRLRERIADYSFFQITGQKLHPMTTLAKLLWWREECPEIFHSAHHFLCWNDALAMLLGLEPAISPSLAARTGMYDLHLHQWSVPILESLDLSPDRLAAIVPSGEVIGEVASSVAEELGLAKNCVLVSGGWDQACAALGAGCTEPGMLVNSLGSTDSLNITFSGIQTTTSMFTSGLSCNPHACSGLYCSNAFSMTGGNLIHWFLDKMGKEYQAEAKQLGCSVYDIMIRHAMESQQPILVGVHFTGTGTPYMDPGARGALLNLTLATELGDIARGILEGLCFEMAVNLEQLQMAGLPIKRILAGGGGAKSDALLQMRSDIFDMPITSLETEELGCVACGMLSWVALHPETGLDALIPQWVKYGETYYPSPDRQPEYQHRFEVYRKVYESIRPVRM